MLERIEKAEKEIKSACERLGRRINIMEVCGTHTVSIFRDGIKSILPDNLKLTSGPGCPVCVTDQWYIDCVVELAGRDDCIIATYGDMVRVPGHSGSLETRPGRVKVIFSSEDALELARKNPDKTVVFVAVGFETTTPATAVAVREADSEGIDNFCILSGHKLVVPAMDAVLSNKNHRIDAFLCPGHVAVIIGYGAFGKIVRQYKTPCVVAGFEAVQILEGLAVICEQLAAGQSELESVYKAVVTRQGNVTAQKTIAECFEAADGYWRGLGKIAKSSQKLKEQYRRFDAFDRFGLKEEHVEELRGCRCGEVISGLIEPPACRLFAKECTPRTPVGPCMVSAEGACAAWYKYENKKK